MSTDAARAALGSVYRITADFLEKRGLLEKVKTQLSPPSRKVLDKLPFAFSWQDYSPLEEIERVLHQASPQLADDLGYAAAEYLSGTVVAPVLKMAFSLFGRTPAALFGNLDRFYSMVVRGFSFRFEGSGPRSGTVVARIEGPGVHESLFRQIRGNLRMIFELSGKKGSVDEPVVLRHDADGAEVSLAVRWE